MSNRRAEMRFGSLFAGIGGFDLGLERAGMSVCWQVEIDPWARKVLAKHWPNVKRYEDVKEVGAHNLEKVDVICGGFPCQDISIAGKGAGIKGEKSGLWTEYARIIDELRPRYVIVENSPMLVNRGLDVVLGEMAEIGYDAEWQCIPAAAVGALHKRDRAWIVAYPHGVGREQDEVFRRPIPNLDGCSEGEEQGRDNIQQGAIGTGEVAYPNCVDGKESRGMHTRLHRPSKTARTERPCREGSGRSGWEWNPEPDVGRVAHGVPARVDRLKGLGNAVVPQVVEWIGHRIMETR